MKIICIEEHLIDVDIVRASNAETSRLASYLADWGTQVLDQPASFGDNRPHLNPPKTALGLAVDSGAARIAEMDRHGIDMQVLSYSNRPSGPTRLVLAPVRPCPGSIRRRLPTSWTAPSTSSAFSERC